MKPAAQQPLAERMRPQRLDEVLGQAHLVGEGGPLKVLLDAGKAPSIVFWGPPGVGKTTLARLIAQHVDAEFVTLSAVMAGVKDIREAVAEAKAHREGLMPRSTILFIDEIHRFNKGQQDALLPYVEDGTLTLIGATTENPSFELNGALLSRVRVLVLRALELEDIEQLLRRALTDADRGLGAAADALPAAWLTRIAQAADGDARKSLVLLETAYELGRAGEVGRFASTARSPAERPAKDGRAGVDQERQDLAKDGSSTAREDELLEKLIGRGFRRFDKQGENHYDQISALHKSVRGSDPDAALYWLARMLDGGVDAGYIARRVTRMAYEDIGLADPRALQLAINAWEAFERIGSPEAELAIAEAVVYCAVAPKSNAVYVAFKAAQAAVRDHGSLDVPLHIRNAPTKLMKDLGYGQGYRYDHEEADAHAAGQQFLPDKLVGTHFYQPTERGLEGQIGEKLRTLRGAKK